MRGSGQTRGWSWDSGEMDVDQLREMEPAPTERRGELSQHPLSQHAAQRRVGGAGGVSGVDGGHLRGAWSVQGLSKAATDHAAISPLAKIL